MRGKLPKALAISLGHAVEHWHATALILLVPFIAHEFNLSYFESGLIISFSNFIAASLNLPNSIAVDVFGRQRLFMTTALAVPAMGYFLLGFAPSYGWIFPCIVFLGFGASCWHPSSMSLLSSLYPERKGFALSSHELGANSGDFLTPIIFTVMIAAFSWRLAAHYMIVPGLAMACLLLVLIRDQNASYGKGMPLHAYGGAVKAMMKNRLVLGMAGVSAMRTMSQVVLVAFLPLYLTREIHLSATQLGIYISSLTVASFFSAPLAGWLSDRIGRGPVLITGLFAGAACVLLLTLAPIGLPFQMTLFAIGVFLYSIRPVIFAAAFDVTPRELGGSLVGLLFTANFACSTLAASLAGWVADVWSISVIFYFGAISLIGGAILTILVLSVSRRKAAESYPYAITSGRPTPRD